jgi:phospholipid/cholesterol/gamma-HCH transport system substrate-binding protein
MKRSVSLTWGSVKIGLLIIFAAVALFWASYTGGGTSIFTPKDKFVCYFADVNGLVAGAPIWMSGVEVGNVSAVRFVNLDEKRKVEIVCKVRRDAWYMISEDASVHLGSIGFLGDRYVEIDPGTIGGPTIDPGDTVPTFPVAGAGALFESGEKAFKGVGSVVTNLDTLMSRMNRGEGTLGKMARDELLYRNMTELLASLTKLSEDLQANQERIVSSLERTSKTIEELGDQVTENRGTLGKIANDPALYDNLAASSARLDTVMTYIQNAEGTMGLLVRDTALYTELVDLLSRANNMVTDIQSNPRKYFKFSVF